MFDNKEAASHQMTGDFEGNHYQTFLKTIRPCELNHHSSLAKSMCVCVGYLNKIVDSLEVCQVVISHVHTNTKVQTSITPVDDLEVSEL